MCDLPVDDSSVVLMQFLWSCGRVVQATEKSGTSCLMRAVLCLCRFFGLGLLVEATDESATECLVNDRGVALM